MAGLAVPSCLLYVLEASRRRVRGLIPPVKRVRDRLRLFRWQARLQPQGLHSLQHLQPCYVLLRLSLS